MVDLYRRLSMYRKLDPDLAMEAKAMVAFAFRNGPIEDLLAGRVGEACNGRGEIFPIFPTTR